MQQYGNETEEDDAGILLERLDLRHGAPEAPFERLARIAAASVQAPMAAVVLAAPDGPWLKSAYGLPPGTPWEALLAFPAVNSGRSVELPDTMAAGPLRMSPLVQGAAAVRYFAAVPITLAGLAVGTLCILDRIPRRLDEKQRDVLRDVSGLISDLLRQRERQRFAPLERRGAQDVARVSGDWVWETDAEHRYTWLSDNFEHERGRAPADFLGRKVPDLEILDQVGRPQKPALRLRRLFEQRQPFSRIVMQVESTRGRRFISFNGTPRFDETTDRFLGFRGTGRDVTPRIGAELRARERGQVLRKLADQVPGMLFQLERRPDGRWSLVYASPGIGELLELRARDLVKDAQRLLQRVHPEDRDAMARSLADAARAGRAWRAEFRVVLPKGGLRWLEGRASAEQRADGSGIWHGFLADVTEPRQAQSLLTAALARWELAAEVAGIGILDVDFETQTVELDRRAARLHGLEALAERDARIPLEAWLGAVEPEERHRLQLALRAVGRSKSGVVVRYRTRAPHEGDGPLMVETALRLAAPVDGTHPPQGNGHGDHSAQRAIGTCHDATQRQRLEEAEREKLAAQEANASKTRFLSRVSHELRTPLNAILGFGQLLQMDDSPARPDADREKIEAIRVAGQKLLALINDMLDLAQIEQGRLKLAPRALDLHDAVHGAQLLLRPLAGERRVEIRNLVPAGTVQAYVDERALGQVLLNIVSNAVKYNREGGSVTASVEQLDEAVVLRIADTGAGLTPEQLGKLFQPFNRLGAEKTSTSGTGLGLVIAKALVEAMHGELGVESERGMGTTVHMRLPLAERVAQAHAPLAGADQPPGELPAACQRTVLYIEDDPVNVVLMQHLFAEEPQWCLVCAGTGEEGVAAALRDQPDLVVSDMNLPDISGRMVRERLAQEPRTAGIPCVALSADAMAEQVDDAMAQGFVDYWTKPVDIKAVHRRLRVLLAQ